MRITEEMRAPYHNSHEDILTNAPVRMLVRLHVLCILSVADMRIIASVSLLAFRGQLQMFERL